METDSDVSREDDDADKDNWQESVILPKEYIAYLQQMLEMLGNFTDMRDGHMGRIKAT